MLSHVTFTRGFPIAVKLEPAKKRYTALDLIQDVERDPDICSFLDSLYDPSKEDEEENSRGEPPPPPRRCPPPPLSPPPSPIPYPSSLSLFADEESI